MGTIGSILSVFHVNILVLPVWMNNSVIPVDMSQKKDSSPLGVNVII